MQKKRMKDVLRTTNNEVTSLDTQEIIKGNRSKITNTAVAKFIKFTGVIVKRIENKKINNFNLCANLNKINSY